MIDGQADVTLEPASGTATLPPILGAMIAYDLKVDGNGLLTINPDVYHPPVPPGGHSAAREADRLTHALVVPPADGQQLAESSPAVLALLGWENRGSAVHQAALDQLFAGSLAGRASRQLGESPTSPLDGFLAPWVDA